MKQHLRFWSIPGIAAIVRSELFCVAGVAYRKAVILTCWQEKKKQILYLCHVFGWNPPALHSILWCLHQNSFLGHGKAGGTGSNRHSHCQGSGGCKALSDEIEREERRFPIVCVCVGSLGGFMLTGWACFRPIRTSSPHLPPLPSCQSSAVSYGLECRQGLGPFTDSDFFSLNKSSFYFFLWILYWGIDD